jgi:uncharacterized protein with PQ loop repeat
MNLKLKAGLAVAGVVAGSITLAVGLKLVAPYITPEIAFNALMLIGVSIVLYTLYGIILTNLEIQQKYKTKLKEMVDKK